MQRCARALSAKLQVKYVVACMDTDALLKVCEGMLSVSYKDHNLSKKPHCGFVKDIYVHVSPLE